MRPRVKLCGNRSEDDIRVALAAGADALGLICGLTHPSPDGLSPDHARELATRIPSSISRVLVTHLTAPDEILALAARIQVDTIQAHGEISLDQLQRLCQQRGSLRVIGVVHVTGPEAVQRAQEVAESVDAVLLDSRTAGQLGGTGRTHDWGISAQIARALPVPVILAGGLCPENVASAIATVRPWGVDVNSGVDAADGALSLQRARAFVMAASSAA